MTVPNDDDDQEWEDAPSIFSMSLPAEFVAQAERARMQGYDEANSLRGFLLEATREELEIVYIIVNNVVHNAKVGPYYLGLITSLLDTQHGVSLVDGKTDAERLREAGLDDGS